ncbi:MAG TPA: TIM barrel protein [Thermoguttaceae bacterium]|nr:TIM barrel protein [Thermoguttaceae bacterium]
MTENKPTGMSRRRWLGGAAAVAGAMGLGGRLWAAERRKRRVLEEGPAVTKGRIRQSVCDWCFITNSSPQPWTLEELCQKAKALGILSVELVQPKDWPILKKYGLVCAMAPSHGFVKGWNHKENWPMCKEKIEQAVDAAAEAGFPNVITFSGFREGMADDVGLENTVAGLKTVIGYAEKKKVTLCIEVLNSRVDVEMKGHPGYMGDTVEWCVEVCKRIGSERMKILFDIYHVQIMQGDLITRIRQFKDYIGHYHVAGVPGRNELGENQEINYPAVLRTIVETGYQGYLAQEFIPTRDPLQSLREAVQLCDV